MFKDLESAVLGAMETSAAVHELRQRGVKPSDPAAAAEARALRDAITPLANMYRLNGEKRGEAVLDWMLATGHAAVEALGDDITEVVPQFKVARCRVDRGLVHASGALTLVEVKDCLQPQEVAKGIGQVLFYKALAERTTNYGPITPVLTALVEHDDDIARACSMAGVLWLPLGEPRFLRTLSMLADLALNPHRRLS